MGALLLLLLLLRLLLLLEPCVAREGGGGNYSRWVEVRTHGAPPPRHQHTAARVGGMMVVFGGMTTAGESNDLWTLALHDGQADASVSLAWKRLCVDKECGDMIYRRAAHSAAVYQQALFIFGGRGEQDGTMNDLWVFDFGAKAPQWQMICSSLQYILWGQCSAPPPVRFGHSAAMLGSRMVIFGGKPDDGDDSFNDVWALDVAASQLKWVQLCAGDSCGKAPSPRAFHGAVMHGERMLVFGGGAWMANDLWQLDLKDFNHPAWRPIPVDGYAPSNRINEAVALVLSSALAVVGGRTLLGYTNDVWVIALEGNRTHRFARERWVMYCEQGQDMCGEAPAPRAGHSLVTVGESTILLYGGRSGSRLFSDVWALSIVDTIPPSEPQPSPTPPVHLVPRTVFAAGTLAGALVVALGGWWFWRRPRHTVLVMGASLDPTEAQPLLRCPRQG